MCRREKKRREVHEGITMFAAGHEACPISARSKFFYAVEFDDDSFAIDVLFENCILINVSFTRCALYGVRFYNLYLEDVDFVDCSFDDFVWLSDGHRDTKWENHEFERSIVGDNVPREIADPKWLADYLASQVIPERPAAQPASSQNSSAAEEWIRAAKPAHVRDDVVERFGDGDPAKFDFSRLGHYVHCVKTPQLERFLADWEEYAEEQERERAQEQAADRLRTTQHEVEEAATDGDAAVPGDPILGSKAGVALPDTFSTGRSSARPPTSPYANRERKSVPPHLRAKVKAMGVSSKLPAADGDDSDAEELVYCPASRLRR